MRDSQTLQLPDGRTLGFAEYGTETGYPLLFVHGFPACRLDGCVLDKIALRRNVRVIAPDRPGYGLSTYNPNLRIVDWPDDVRVLAKHLGITQFAMLGSSGGGPSTVACAYALPKDMLSAVGLLASSGPWEAGTHDIPLMARMAKHASIYFPSGSTGITNLLVAALRYTKKTSLVTSVIDQIIEKGKAMKSRTEAPTDETTEEKRARVLRIILEPFAQGAAGFVQDARLLSHPWGFKLEDVKFDKIQIWHPTKDENAPVWMARYMAEHLPHSILKEFEDDDHYTVVRHAETVVSELLSGVIAAKDHEDPVERLPRNDA